MAVISRRARRNRRFMRLGSICLFFVVGIGVVGFFGFGYNSASYDEQQQQIIANLQQWQQQLLSSSSSAAKKKYRIVDCSQHENLKDNTDITSKTNTTTVIVEDPNRGMAESPKKFIQGNTLLTQQTSTTRNDNAPSFWISLHKQHFDMARWNSIMKQGRYYETQITQQFLEILGKDNKNQNELVMDIGMNIGWFTILSRAMGYNVASFEPNPIMHNRVCESIKLNHFNNNIQEKTTTGPQIQIFPYGLGSGDAQLQFTMGRNPGGSSFHEDRLAKRYRKYVTVPVTTLDGIAVDQGWLARQEGRTVATSTVTIRLLKMDVEGYESQVWKGGKQLLQSGAIKNILMEKSESKTEQFSSMEIMHQDPVLSMLVDIYQSGYHIHALSTSNGAQPYHPEMVPDLNKVLQKAVDYAKQHQSQSSPSTSDHHTLTDIEAKLVSFMAKVTFNVWFVQTSSSLSSS